MVWYGMVWHGMVWYGLGPVWYGLGPCTNRVSATKQTLRARAMICAVLRACAVICDMFVPPPEEQHSSQITAHAHAHAHAHTHARTHAPTPTPLLHIAARWVSGRVELMTSEWVVVG